MRRVCETTTSLRLPWLSRGMVAEHAAGEMATVTAARVPLPLPVACRMVPP